MPVRVASDPYEIVCPSHNPRPPAPLPPEPAVASLAESAPGRSLAWFETQSLAGCPLVHSVPHPGTTLPADISDTRSANSKCHVLTDKLTATWQLSDLPISPQYCRATPTECFPCFGKPVSSMIQATTGPCFCMAGSTCCRTCSSISWSFHGASATK